MTRAPHEDHYAAQVVVEDLEYLRTTLSADADDATLRRSSATLRQLLIEDEFGRAWRWAGFEREPRLFATDLAAMLRGRDLAAVAYAQAGGAKFKGAEIAGVFLFMGEVSPDGKKEPPRQRFGLRAFLESPSVVVGRLEEFEGETGAREHRYVPNFVSSPDHSRDDLGGPAIDSVGRVTAGIR